MRQFEAYIEPYQQWMIYFQSFLSKSRGSREARRLQGRYYCSAAEAVEFLSTKHNYEIADRLAIIANLCNYEVRLDAQKLKLLGYDLAVSVFCLARLPDGITYSDLGVKQFSWEHITLQVGHGQDALDRTADMEIGPPSFSWAPCLVEGFTERPRIRKNNTRYALEFLGSSPKLHIYGWLWRRYEALDFSNLAEIFGKRLSNNTGDSKSSSSLEEKWGMTTANQLECFWDLIQEFRNRQMSTVAEALWISLVMFNKCVKHILSIVEPDTSPSFIDPRDDKELRHTIHDISMERFKKLLSLGPESTRNIVIPYYWMVQNIIAGDAINLWKLDDTCSIESENMADSTPGAQHALLNHNHSIALFTPFTQSAAPRTPHQALADEQRLLSWPVSVTECLDDGTRIAIKIDRVDLDESSPFNPVVGFWNTDKIPPRPYILS